jgi:hypothetical protein
LIFAFPLFVPKPVFVMILILTTLGIHWLSNAFSYFVGLKKHPW